MTPRTPSRISSHNGSPAKKRPPKIEKRIEQGVRKLSGRDAALYFHHLTLFDGEYAIWQRGKSDWELYLRTKRMRQYRAVEQSVIRAWRMWLTRALGIPRKKQTDLYAVNRGIVLEALLRKPSHQHAAVLRRRAGIFYAAAKRGDTGFLQAVGRLLEQAGETNRLRKKHQYSHAMISHWITGYYWLMSAGWASARLSDGLGVPDKPKSFASAKSRYGLKSHQPDLVERFDRVAPGLEAIVLTQEGKRLLRLTGKRRPH